MSDPQTDPQGDRWHGEAVTDEASPRSGASVVFVSDGDNFAPRRELLLSAVTKVAKSTGRNCVSALPQRAIPGSDLLRILADIAFHHRCRSKGLCLHSFPLPLASATAGVFHSYRRTPKPSPLMGRGAECRTPSSLPPEGFAVLNDTPVACQTRGPTRRETGVSEADG